MQMKPIGQHLEEKTERIAWIDVAKGLGMVLVIYGHMLYSGTWKDANRAIYSFHMPMYFVLSGYIAHRRRGTFCEFVKRKYRELVVPSIIFIVLTLPMYFCLEAFPKDRSIIRMIEDICFFRGKIAYNDPVWFLLVMFQVLILFDVMQLSKWSVCLRAWASILFFGTGYIIYKTSLFLPFGIEKTVVCMGFYVFGSVIRDLPKTEALCIKGNVLPLAAFAVWFISGVMVNGKVSLYNFSLKKYWMFILSGLSGSLVWFRISYMCRHIKVFSVWGRNTILVLGTHYVLVTIIREMAAQMDIAKTITYDVLAFVIAITMLIAYMPFCRFVEKRFPEAVGKQMR